MDSEELQLWIYAGYISMAGKKKQIIFQTAITNQEEWDEMLAMKGLNVVDVYQQWCGPCQTITTIFRKIKNELEDDRLHYATAEADGIVALKQYCGKCQPVFLFYAEKKTRLDLKDAHRATTLR
ncbi:thioredoxin domain-containing protein 6 isoform X2 [Amia ocellicauda]|uniref:thioredoxin domain-containing protein 6 isoform X2 n=1 Tax=Amia ocellicauda TaxID=2972642 RepID=UPI003464AFBF